MRKNIQVKKYSSMTGGELPDTKSLRGINAEAKAIRHKFRSPFRFGGGRPNPQQPC